MTIRVGGPGWGWGMVVQMVKIKVPLLAANGIVAHGTDVQASENPPLILREDHPLHGPALVVDLDQIALGIFEVWFVLFETSHSPQPAKLSFHSEGVLLGRVNVLILLPPRGSLGTIICDDVVLAAAADPNPI